MGKYVPSFSYGAPNISRRASNFDIWQVKLAVNAKDGRYFAQIGPSIYSFPTDEVSKLARAILESDKTRSRSFKVVPGYVTVPKSGRGRKVIVKNTRPADDSEINILNEGLFEVRLVYEFLEKDLET